MKGYQMTITLAYQNVATSIQVIGGFMKTIMLNPVNLEDLVQWEPDDQSRYTNRLLELKRPNFRNLNDFLAADLCPYQDYYQDNQGNTVTKEYKIRQYFEWSNWKINKWNLLSEEQREYLLKNDLAQSVSRSMYFHEGKSIISKFRFYSAKQSDDTWYELHPEERLFSDRFWNSKEFGGPFSCNKQNNESQSEYSEYELPNESYFINYDQTHSSCTKDSLGTCKCSYYSEKRVFPIVWRCRPWYTASVQNPYITFADAYSDIDTGSLITTVSYKLVKPNVAGNLEEEKEAEAYAVQSIDLLIDRLQNQFGTGNKSDVYSYLVAPMTYNYDDDNNTYYQYTAYVHPLMNGTKQTILTLEFENSTNPEVEKLEYQQKTASFLQNSTVRRKGCSKLTTKNQFSMYITNNRTEYYTLFDPIKICYGNMEEQNSLVIGYFALSISTNKQIELTKEIKETLSNMQITIIWSLVMTFGICCFCLYSILKQLLRCNFEEPIFLFSSVIKEFDPQQVHELCDLVEGGKIQMQLELKNLIQAIDSVVIKVQTQIQRDLEESEWLKEDLIEKQLSLYKSAFQTFQAVEHEIGMGMCYNNIGNIFMRKKDFTIALVLYKQAFQISTNFYQKQIQSGEPNKSYELLLTDPIKRSFMKIYSSRQYQIGQTLLKIVNEEKIQKFSSKDDELEQFIEFKAASQYSLIFQNGTLVDFIKNENNYFRLSTYIKNDKTMQEENEKSRLGQTISMENSKKQECENELKENNFRNRKRKRRTISLADKKEDFRKFQIRSPAKYMSEQISALKQATELQQKTLLRNNSFNQSNYQISNIKSDQNVSKTEGGFIISLNSTRAITENIKSDLLSVTRDINSTNKLQGEKYKTSSINTNNNTKDIENNLHLALNSSQYQLPLDSQKFQNRNSLLQEAIDLFKDVKNIFDKLADYSTTSENKEAYEYYNMSIMTLLKLAHCQLLIGERSFMVKDLLKQAKEQIKIIRRFNNNDLVVLHEDILISKYFLLKGEMRIQENNYDKALKNMLSSLNYYLTPQDNLKAGNLFHLSDTKFHFYDPLDILRSLTLLQFIISETKIPITNHQKTIIERDFKVLKILAEDISEPYFFEVFFKYSPPSKNQLNIE